MAKYNPLLGPSSRSAAADRKAAAAARDAQSARWRDAMHKAADDGYNPRPAAGPDHEKVRELARSLSKPFAKSANNLQYLDARNITLAVAVNRAAEGYLLYALPGRETQIFMLTEAVEKFANYITDNKAALERVGAYSDDTTLRAAAALLRLYQDSGRALHRMGNPRSYPNIEKASVGQSYIGYAGFVTYDIVGKSGDWRARLDSRYTDSLWARENLAPLSFGASDFAGLSATLERIERACATRPEGSPFHPDYKPSRPLKYLITNAYSADTGKPIYRVESEWVRHGSKAYVGEWHDSRAEAERELAELTRTPNRHGGGLTASEPLDPYREGNPAASRFVLLDAGPSEGWHGAHERYTLICTTPQGSGSRTYYNLLGFGPGVSGHGELTASDFNALKAERFRSLGKRIKIEALPSNYRHLAERFMADC